MTGSAGASFDERSLVVHEQLRGKIGLHVKLPVRNRDDLSLAYTPGVAEPCRVIAEDRSRARDLTLKGNAVAVVSDGSAVLGLGNIGPEAAIPVMEGKALLFKTMADIDAWPICVDTQDADEIVETVRRIAPVFGGINLEDIAAPRCFEVEDRLQDLGIPVFHDDQHGTAIVLLAALQNAAAVTGRFLGDLRVVISGAGAAGTAIARLLGKGEGAGLVSDLIVCDSRGALHPGRDGLNPIKHELATTTNREGRAGSLAEVIEGCEAFIGVSQANVLGGDAVERMASDPIILAMANPIPEIDPQAAHAAGAAVVGTGRSDLPNQVNNVLAFPGLFRGALDAGAPTINSAMKLAAVKALADAVGEPSAERILPDPLDPCVTPLVATAVAAATAEPS
ncbi:MAG: NADP-dependent malic enzyme [Acidobacteriota bacterium]